MTEPNTILKTYTQIIGMLKENVAKDIVTAVSQGTINIERVDLEKLLALQESLIDTYSANGYELLQRTATSTTTNTPRRKPRK